MAKEIEATFLNIDVAEAHNKLTRLGMINKKPRTLMRRKAFHFEEDVKQHKRRWARVRDEGDKITLTLKSIVGEGINSVFENEVVIDNFDEGAELIKAFGMVETAYQETYREEWIDKDNCIFITIDEWPHLKAFMEIEGKTENVVKDYTEKLELNFNEALFGDVSKVYELVYHKPYQYFCGLPRITFDMSLDEFLHCHDSKLK